MEYLKNYSTMKTKRTSIIKKLMHMGMVSSSVALTLAFVFFSIFTLLTIKFMLTNELDLISKLIMKRAGPALFWQDKQVAKSSLSDLSVKNSIIFACIYDDDGTIFSEYSIDKNDICPPYSKNFRNKTTIDSLTAFNQIEFSGEVEGYLYIKSNLDDLYTFLYNFFVISILLLVPIIMVVYIISSKYKNYIAHPILALKAATRSIIDHKNYNSRATKIYDDEIGDLTDSFNEMMQKVQDAKSNLETKVAERTADLRKTLHDLERALDAKSNFLANMSHEIRTPIHGIRNFGGFLIKDWDITPEEQRKNFAEKIYKASNRLLDLINNLLDLSKLDAHEMEFEFSNHNLIALVKEHVTESEALIGDKPIAIQFIPPETEEIRADFDSGRISQVITNLLGNAVKYSHEGTIDVSLNLETHTGEKDQPIEMVSFSIADEGVGIPEEELEHIFDKFAESSHTKSQAGGTGLGLSICQEIIHAHNGKIWAKNNPERGATLTFTIPIQQDRESME